jgi:hypothetical protein
MVYTWGEIGTCIHKVPGISGDQKSEGRGGGHMGSGQEVCSTAIGPKSSVGHVYRWWMMGRSHGELLERRGW